MRHPIKPSRSALLPFILLLIATVSLFAQQDEMQFTNLTIENGLSNSKVNCIFQDREGFLWFGTNEGLNKFDGYTFTTFQQDPENPNSISANLIRCIAEDRDGTLWIGTEGGGLNWLDRNDQTFHHYSADSSSTIRLSGNNINAILQDSRGRLWLGSERGLHLLLREQNKALHFLPFPDGTANEILTIFEDAKGNLWLGSLGGGLMNFDPEKGIFNFFTHDESDPNSISDNEIRSIYEDRQGQLWIGTTYGGLNRYDYRNRRFSKFYPGRGNPESTTIRAILEDGRGNLWVGNRSGLYQFDRSTGRFRDYRHDPNNPNSLVQNSVQTIFQDAKGDLWIGTRGGISYLNSCNLAFTHYRADVNNPRCLKDQAVYCILEDHQGDIWFGTENSGLNRLHKKTGHFTYYQYKIDDPRSLSVNNVKALLQDRDGSIWVGTFNGGLNKYSEDDNRFIRLTHDRRDSNSLAMDNVLALLQEKNGDIWVGTYGGGLDRFVRRTRRFHHQLKPWHAEGFANIHCLLHDRHGRVWMGANQNRIGCLDPTTGVFISHRLSQNSKDVEVRSALEDRNGKLWFGTVGSGLYRFDPTDNHVTAFSKIDGLPSNIVVGLLEDSSGNLWLSTSNGLCRFDPATRQIKNYYKENGLQSDQFHYNAYMKTRDGQLFFGGINGVTAFYPQQLQENTHVPPVVITEFAISNKPVPIGGQHPILTRDISQTDALALSYRHSVFSFEFVALNYAISERNRYAYKMEGFDPEWNYVGSRRFATYTNLNPGSYTFRVKAANSDGVWNESGASIAITISPPFWQRWWSKVLVLLIGLLLVNHSINYLRQRRDLLKAKNLANLAQLKLLRSQMNPHFLFNTLGSIRSMILLSKEKAWDMVTELSEFLRYTLVNFNKVGALLDDEINAVNNYLNIEKVRYGDSVQISFKIDDQARACLVPAFICQPLVENAIKYGMQTSPMPLQVNIAILLQRETLSIDVSNSGTLAAQQSANPETRDGHGHSLQNIKQQLGIMFRDQYTFSLEEEEQWVHAKIRINCRALAQDLTKNQVNGSGGFSV